PVPTARMRSRARYDPARRSASRNRQPALPAAGLPPRRAAFGKSAAMEQYRRRSYIGAETSPNAPLPDPSSRRTGATPPSGSYRHTQTDAARIDTPGAARSRLDRAIERRPTRRSPAVCADRLRSADTSPLTPATRPAG